MKVKTGLMAPTRIRRPWLPRVGLLFGRPYLVWFGRFYWLLRTRDLDKLTGLQ